MPKGPILKRYLLVDNFKGAKRLLHWNLVETALGNMVEPRNMQAAMPGKIVQTDAIDNSFNDVWHINEDEMPARLGTAGLQVPVDFNPA